MNHKKDPIRHISLLSPLMKAQDGSEKYALSGRNGFIRHISAETSGAERAGEIGKYALPDKKDPIRHISLLSSLMKVQDGSENMPCQEEMAS